MNTYKLWMNSAIIATALTMISYTIGVVFDWIIPSEINFLEVFAVFTSYMCTWMCVHQTRWNYPIGVAATLAYTLLFYTQEMYAVAAFNLYLVFSLAYGWFRWGPDGEKSRPVTTVKGLWWLGYLGIGLVILGLLTFVNLFFGVTITGVEILITVLSGIAQFLLDNKKIETWPVWILVNILSIWFFATNGLTLVAFQYVFFLMNAFYGMYRWNETIDKPTDLVQQFPTKA